MQTVSSPSSTVPENAEANHGKRNSPAASGERRRVFFLVDSLQIGGTETQAVELALRLDPARYAVSLGCLRMRGPLLTKLAGSNVSVMEWDARGGVNSLSGIYQIFRLARFLRRGHFDVVHTHDLWSNLLGIAAARLARVPVVISSRRDLAHLAWYTPRRRKILRHLQSLSSAVLVNSAQIREQLVREDGFRPELIRVVHNGIDLERFRNGVGNRERLFPGIQDCKLVVNVANMHSDIKGQPTLITAAREVCAKFPQARFVLIGDGTRKAAFESMVAELGLKQNFLFLGQRHDVAELLACCDIAVLPSQVEGFPNALLEYMAAGLPAIATDVGGSREVVQHGVNGWLTPPNDPNALAKSILYLLENPAAASELAHAGRERVRRDFSFERLIANVDAMYTQLLNARANSYIVTVTK
jgi:glycosyltransferase involved in cell wall biosynthesis